MTASPAIMKAFRSPDAATRNPGSGGGTAMNYGNLRAIVKCVGAGDDRDLLRDPGFRCASSGLREAIPARRWPRSGAATPTTLRAVLCTFTATDGPSRAGISAPACRPASAVRTCRPACSRPARSSADRSARPGNSGNRPSRQLDIASCVLSPFWCVVRGASPSSIDTCRPVVGV